jgi:hypothetical protein
MSSARAAFHCRDHGEGLVRSFLAASLAHNSAHLASRSSSRRSSRGAARARRRSSDHALAEHADDGRTSWEFIAENLKHGDIPGLDYEVRPAWWWYLNAVITPAHPVPHR